MQLSRPIKYLYSLHRRTDKQPFVVHLMRPDETSRTALLGFTIKKDANSFGNVFEQFKAEKGHYPNNHFTYEKPFELEYIPEKELKLDVPLEEIYVEETAEEDMYNWCSNYNMDLMLIHDLENEGRLQVIEFEVDMEDIRKKLEDNLK